MNNLQRPTKASLTFREIAQQLRMDLQSVADRVIRGENVTIPLRVWKDGEVVTLILSNEELVSRMQDLEGALVWEDARRRVAQTAEHPLERVLVPAMALA